MNQALHGFLSAKLGDPSLLSSDRTKALEIALVATGAKPAWLWESIDPEGQSCPEAIPLAIEFVAALEQAGWAVRHTHLNRPLPLGLVGVLMRPIMGEHYPAVHYDAVVAAPEVVAADRLLAAYRAARPKRTRAGEIALGAALGYPPHATRNPGLPRLTELCLPEAPGAEDLWICGFVDDQSGRREATTWLSTWASAMAAEFPGLWPLPKLADETGPGHPAHRQCSAHPH